MKEKMNILCEIVKNKDFTTRELVLAGINIFLVGLLAGMVISPKRKIAINCSTDRENEEK